MIQKVAGLGNNHLMISVEYNHLMIGEQIRGQRTNCFPGTCGSGELIVDQEGKIWMSLDRVNELSRVNESDGSVEELSNRVGLIAVMYRVGLIEGELIELNQMLKKDYLMDLWEVKVGKQSTKCVKKNWKCVGTGTPFEKKNWGRILMGGAVARIKCNWTYMASLKRLSRGSGCHVKVDPGNIKRKACKKVVEQGGNRLRKTVKKEMKGEIWVTKSKRRLDQHIKLIELKLSRV